jgi:phage terminase Nu1 subunit (DNA packaging protein)
LIPSTLNQKDVAAALGLSVKQVQNLEAGGVLQPELEEGRKVYPWPASVRKYIAFRVQQTREQSSTGRERKETDLRIARVNAANAEIDLAKRQGTMIHIDDVEKLVEEPLRLVAGALKNLPSRWAPDMVGCPTIQEATTRLKRAIGEVLENLHETGAKVTARPAAKGRRGKL